MFGRGMPEWTPSVHERRPRCDRARCAPSNPLKVVYLPTASSRTLGAAPGGRDRRSVPQTAPRRSCARPASRSIYPQNLSSLCCGMAFSSKGFREESAQKLAEVEAALVAASQDGAFPILLDTSPCFYTLKNALALDPRLRLHDPVEFTLAHLADKLDFHPVDETVAVHGTCSAVKLGLDARTRKLAEMCAARVTVPPSVGCCGWAGDRGFSYPELTASALIPLRRELPRACTAGYSTSRTCGIGLSRHGGIPYQSILSLVDRATSKRAPAPIEERPPPVR